MQRKGKSIMDAMFQWFYDILAITIVILFVYSSAKKGFSKTVLIMSGYLFSILIASNISGAIADTFYSNAVMKSNISAISENTAKIELSQKYKTYIESSGYNIKTDASQLETIFKSGENISEKVYEYCCNAKGTGIEGKDEFIEKFQTGYADILFDALKSDIPEYALKSLYSSPADFDKNIQVMYSEDSQEAGKYIEENYIREPLVSLISAVCFIIVISAFMIIIRIIADKLNNAQIIKPFGISDHLLGGVLGIAESVIILIIAAVCVKVLIAVGNDEMMLFNSETVEKTKFFRYIFNLKYIN